MEKTVFYGVKVCWATTFLFVALLALAGPSARGAETASTPATTRVLGLQAALRYALEHSPSLEQDRQRRRIGEWNYQTSKAKLLPSLDLDTVNGLQWSHLPISSTQPWTSSLTGSLTENLYDNGATFTNIDISRLGRDASELTVQESRDGLLRDVAVQFYTYSLNEKLIDVRKQQRELVEKQFRSVNSQYEQGFKTKKDYLRFHAQVQQAEIGFRNAVLDAESAAAQLKNLIGVPPAEFGADEIGFEILDPKTLDLTVPTATPDVQKTYEVKIARLQTDVQPLQVRLAERNLWPQLNLTTGFTYTNGNYLGTGNTYAGLPPTAGWGANENYNFNVLLELKFNVWDWGIRRRDVETASANQIVQENELRKTELSTASTLRTLMLTLSQLKGNYELSRDLLDSEEQSYGFVKRDYDEGKLTSTDLIQNLNELLDARVQYYSAQYNLAQSLAKYHYYLGDLYAKFALP